MLPGVQHCGGGPGPDFSDALDRVGPAVHGTDYNIVENLETWVELGKTRSSVVATRYIDSHQAGYYALDLLAPTLNPPNTKAARTELFGE